ncbi:hypothetical protein LSAT2_008393 [Lamellibrachia satsuma]|nr:hypothetical protein LSAT2_008393 [Lamellibrachia satsuma]
MCVFSSEADCIRCSAVTANVNTVGMLARGQTAHSLAATTGHSPPSGGNVKSAENKIRPPVVTSARRDGYYQSPNDCSKYLLCKASQCSVLSCSKPLVFNPETNTCQQASRVEKTYLSKCRM